MCYLSKKRYYICTIIIKQIEIMNYLNIEISFYENQTIGNCIDLGYGSELIKKIILEMRNNKLQYLSKRELTKFRN